MSLTSQGRTRQGSSPGICASRRPGGPPPGQQQAVGGAGRHAAHRGQAPALLDGGGQQVHDRPDRGGTGPSAVPAGRGGVLLLVTGLISARSAEPTSVLQGVPRRQAVRARICRRTFNMSRAPSGQRTRACRERRVALTGHLHGPGLASVTRRGELDPGTCGSHASRCSRPGRR